MPIAKEDRISKESTVSRYMQLRIPGFEPGDDFEEHENLSKFDTNDKTIIENQVKEPLQIVVNSLSLIVNDFADLRNDLYSVESREIGVDVDVKEPFPTSDKGDYNQMSVIIDRDGHTLFFDYTDGNNRTFLHHPGGSYLNIDNNGNWVFVAQTQPIAVIDDEGFIDTDEIGGNWSKFIKGSDFTIIDGEESKAVGGDKKTNVKSDNYLTVEQNDNVSIGGTRATNIKEYENIEIGKDRTTIITRNELLNIRGYKEQNLRGVYIVNSADTILFNAPKIEFRTKKLITTNEGSMTETVGGEKRIEANQISLSSGNDINMNAGASLFKTVFGTSEETVIGLPFLPTSIYTKTTEVNVGSYKLDVLLGDIELKTARGAGPLLTLSFLSQSINLSTILGGININPAGITIVSGTRIDLGGATTSPSPEPALLGLTHTAWAAAHIHPTGVGPSGVPTTAGTLQSSLSKKVFIAIG